MRHVRQAAPAGICALAAWCLLSGRPAAQAPKPGAVELVDRYAHGEFDAVVSILEATNEKDFDDLLNGLKSGGTAWIAAGGVKREGWHELSVTVPRYPSYEINARRGYSIDTPPQAATAAGPAAPARDYDTVANAFRRMPDLAKAIKAFRAGGNPWPATPRLEAVLALDLADAAFASGQDDARAAAAEMLLVQLRLVRRPIEPDDFERLWLWTALAVLEGAIRPALAQPFLAAALARLPDESRLVLGRAILSDQRFPMGMLDEVAAAAGAPIVETAAHYDAAIGFADAAAEARVRKAWFLHRIGRHAEALVLLDQAAPRPSDSLLFYWRNLFRGQVLDALGRLDDAVASYRAALAAYPRAQSANVALMNALVRSGGRDEARALAETIQTTSPSDEDPYWLYWYGDLRIRSAAMARLREMSRVPQEPR